VLGVALLAVVAAAAGSVGWVARDRTARQARLTGQVELILEDVDRLEQEQKWREASAALERAEAVLAGGEASDAVTERVREERRGLAFIAELDRIRQHLAATVDGKFDNGGAARDYARAFRQYGIDLEALSVAEAIARLQGKSGFLAPISASLDDWVRASKIVNNVDPIWKTLVAVVRGLDPDPLRNRLRALWGQPRTPERQAELQRP
jgi:hypothetical protein